MTMNTTTKKTTAQPIMPTHEEYRHGMKKLRVQLNCPVLSLEKDDVADELREFNWSAQSNTDAPAMPNLHPQPSVDEYLNGEVKNRPSVADYLKKRYQENMLARYPDFEANTETDIAALKLQMNQMYVFNMIIVILLGLVALLGGWILLAITV